MKEPAESVQQEHDACFHRLFAANPLPMWVCDQATLRFLQVNEAAIAFYGYSRDEFLNMQVPEICVAGDPGHGGPPAEHPPATSPAVMETRHRRRNGRLLDVEIRTQEFELEGRRVSLAVVFDISDRERGEAELRLLATAIEQSTESIVITDSKGVIQYVNPAFGRTTGYSREEAVGQSPRLLRSGKHSQEFYERLWDTITSGQTWSGEMVNRKKDGTLFDESMTITPVRDRAGRITQFIKIAHDVSERKALEKHLRQAQKFEAIGQLAGGIAHDFNNVIGAIMGWAEIGRDMAPPDSVLRSHFGKIHQQANRAAGLTRQLLAFARRQILEPRYISLNQVVTDVLNLLERVIGKDIELQTRLAPHLKPVQADPSQLEQVLMNLCVNARDAMPRGGRLSIETHNSAFDDAYCRTHAYARPGEYVLLAVSDTGIGMDRATQEHIFEPFFTTKELGKGTGLGLATVYGIVKQHNGFVHVYSELGAGSIFRIYLPVATVEGSLRESKSPPADESVRGGSETILVAEDHDGMRELAQSTLEKLGYRVLLARDGAEALELLRRHGDEVALAVLDVVMPKLSGPDAYSRMCAAKPGLQAIFATGYSTELDALVGLLHQGVPVLQKPYSAGQLARKIRELLDRAAASAVPSEREPAGTQP